jgi:hypothetical protein
MEDPFADRVFAGSAVYSLRALRNDLMEAIIKDEQLKKKPKFYFEIYWGIIYMIAVGHEEPETIEYLLNVQSHLGLSKDEINYHISRAKSDYRRFLELMMAIINSRVMDFEKMGAAVEEAFDCFDEWIQSELM